MESTYDMYANELRYELVYAVFAEQIEVQNYKLPFSIRKPRPAKMSDPEMSPFSVVLRRTFVTHDLYGVKSGKGKTRKKIPQLPSTPANSLHDDEALVEKRRFILPLVEANETIALFDQAENDA